MAWRRSGVAPIGCGTPAWGEMGSCVRCIGAIHSWCYSQTPLAPAWPHIAGTVSGFPAWTTATSWIAANRRSASTSEVGRCTLGDGQGVYVKGSFGTSYGRVKIDSARAAARGYSISMLKARVRRRSVFAVIGGVIVILSGCATVPRSRNGSSAEIDVGDKTVTVPAFSISVRLSDAAKQRLQSMGESVIVIAYFDGDPLPGQGKYNPPMRDVFLGDDERLVDGKNVATFGSTKISKSSWDRLANKDYFVTINVVSARRASRDNLLECPSPEDRISKFAGRATEVLCRLIGEDEVTSK